MAMPHTLPESQRQLPQRRFVKSEIPAVIDVAVVRLVVRCAICSASLNVECGVHDSLIRVNDQFKLSKSSLEVGCSQVATDDFREVVLVIF